MPERQQDAAAPIAVGIVGAGRTRNGLGPFLAKFLERAGCRITGVAGRSATRASTNAATLGEQLGHDVRPCASLDELCTSGIAAVVIACPPEHHLPALRTALDARLAVLCEKPLVHERDLLEGAFLASRFVREGVVLAENCHWPFVLPAVRPFLEERREGPIRNVSLGLTSVAYGRTIVQNTLSHLLSLAQAVAPVNSDTRVEDVSLDRPSLQDMPNVLRCRLTGPGMDVSPSLHLDVGESGGRPAWLAIDDVRMERRIGEGHAFSFVRNGREIPTPDPMEQLVFRFSDWLRAADRTSAAAEGEAVCQRLRLYRDVLSRI